MDLIPKRAWSPLSFVRRTEPFPTARLAFKALLSRMGVPGKGSVLLPAYVGWSPREGSGVFDPIRELGAAYRFYRVTRELRIDLDDLAGALGGEPPRVLLLIHYFGYPDPFAGEAAILARDAGVLVVEDEAHALFSDLVGGVCGRAGAASFFSLHKMLPLDTGGLLVVNDLQWHQPSRDAPPLQAPAERLLDFDLAGIARVRKENTAFLARKLEPLAAALTPLRPEVPLGVIPQTFPVLLRQAPRDDVYARMNAAGFGVVSLYHTLIPELREAAFPDSHWISRRVLNLPVHQDAMPETLEAMVRELAGVLGVRA